MYAEGRIVLELQVERDLVVARRAMQVVVLVQPYRGVAEAAEERRVGGPHRHRMHGIRVRRHFGDALRIRRLLVRRGGHVARPDRGGDGNPGSADTSAPDRAARPARRAAARADGRRAPCPGRGDGRQVRVRMCAHEARAGGIGLPGPQRRPGPPAYPRRYATCPAPGSAAAGGPPGTRRSLGGAAAALAPDFPRLPVQPCRHRG